MHLDEQQPDSSVLYIYLLYWPHTKQETTVVILTFNNTQHLGFNTNFHLHSDIVTSLDSFALTVSIVPEITKCPLTFIKCLSVSLTACFYQYHWENVHTYTHNPSVYIPTNPTLVKSKMFSISSVCALIIFRL